VDGKPSKNPRYLQKRPDLVAPARSYLAEMAARLRRRCRRAAGAHAGQRRAAGPPQQSARTGIRSLAVFNPIHYFELPELFMEFICSMTGKSPSTTGAGSEGALTKAPFNALPPIIDLNNALVSFILTGRSRVRHRRRLCRAKSARGPRREPARAGSLVPHVAGGARSEIPDRKRYLEKCEDFDFNGKKVLASRLGYRINARFVRTLFRARVQSSARRLHRGNAEARNCRTWPSSRTAWTTSSPRKSAWRAHR
jgi:phosphoenolpyruvate carboxykinase (diphosphate)